MELNATQTVINEENPWDNINFTSLEYVILGSIFMILIVSCIVPYLIVLYIFIINPKFNRHFSYWIMLHLGIMDILQLLTYFGFMGIMMLMNTSVSYLPNRILCSIAMATWTGTVIMTLILAINRFINLIEIQLSICINENFFYRILLVLGYIYLIGWVIVTSLPDLGLTLDVIWFIYEKDFEKLNLLGVCTYINLFLLMIALMLYLIAVGYLIYKRHFQTSNTQLIAHRELRLFFQAMFICVYKSVVGVMISYWIAPNNLSYAIFYCFALLESGYNPYMYILLNKALRREVARLFSLAPKNMKIIQVKVVSFHLAERAPTEPKMNTQINSSK